MKMQLSGRREFEEAARSIQAEATGLDVNGKDWTLTSSIVEYTNDNEKPATEIKLELKSENRTRGIVATIDTSES